MFSAIQFTVKEYLKDVSFHFKLAYDSINRIYTIYSRSIWVILGPYSDKLVQVVSAQYGRISRQIVKVVHNNSHKQVQHLQIKNEFSIMWLILPTIWSKKMGLSKSFTTSTVCECACFFMFVLITAPILWTVLLWYFGN